MIFIKVMQKQECYTYLVLFKTSFILYVCVHLSVLHSRKVVQICMSNADAHKIVFLVRNNLYPKFMFLWRGRDHNLASKSNLKRYCDKLTIPK